jgi:hypothetical protein
MGMANRYEALIFIRLCSLSHASEKDDFFTTYSTHMMPTICYYLSSMSYYKVVAKYILVVILDTN